MPTFKQNILFSQWYKTKILFKLIVLSFLLVPNMNVYGSDFDGIITDIKGEWYLVTDQKENQKLYVSNYIVDNGEISIKSPKIGDFIQILYKNDANLSYKTITFHCSNLVECSKPINLDNLISQEKTYKDKFTLIKNFFITKHKEYIVPMISRSSDRETTHIILINNNEIDFSTILNNENNRYYCLNFLKLINSKGEYIGSSLSIDFDLEDSSNKVIEDESFEEGLYKLKIMSPKCSQVPLNEIQVSWILLVSNNKHKSYMDRYLEAVQFIKKTDSDLTDNSINFFLLSTLANLSQTYN